LFSIYIIFFFSLKVYKHSTPTGRERRQENKQAEKGHEDLFGHSRRSGGGVTPMPPAHLPPPHFPCARARVVGFFFVEKKIFLKKKSKSSCKHSERR